MNLKHAFLRKEAKNKGVFTSSLAWSRYSIPVSSFTRNTFLRFL